MTKERFGNKDYIPSMKLSGVCDSLGVTGKKFGDGACSVTCEVTNDHLNAGGVAHGGFIQQCWILPLEVHWFL